MRLQIQLWLYNNFNAAEKRQWLQVSTIPISVVDNSYRHYISVKHEFECRDSNDAEAPFVDLRPESNGLHIEPLCEGVVVVRFTRLGINGMIDCTVFSCYCYRCWARYCRNACKFSLTSRDSSCRRNARFSRIDCNRDNSCSSSMVFAWTSSAENTSITLDKASQHISRVHTAVVGPSPSPSPSVPGPSSVAVAHSRRVWPIVCENMIHKGQQQSLRFNAWEVAITNIGAWNQTMHEDCVKYGYETQLMIWWMMMMIEDEPYWDGRRWAAIQFYRDIRWTTAVMPPRTCCGIAMPHTVEWCAMCQSMPAEP